MSDNHNNHNHHHHCSHDPYHERDRHDCHDDFQHLFERNRIWAKQMSETHPGFFTQLSQQQKPKYMWIGCADSRVSADQLLGLMPGEVFVHRNIANCVVHSDLNCLSVLQYAVEVLKVEKIIVTGHYKCGGVMAALQPVQYGLIDNWIRHLKDVVRNNYDELFTIDDESKRVDRLVELNVIQQVYNVVHTTIVQNAWKRGQNLSVVGWVYGVHNGLLKELVSPIHTIEQIQPMYRMDFDFLHAHSAPNTNATPSPVKSHDDEHEPAKARL